MKKIEWNKVTWYSWILAGVIFLIIIPLLTFYFVGQYKDIQLINSRIGIPVTSTVLVQRVDPTTPLRIISENYILAGTKLYYFNYGTSHWLTEKNIKTVGELQNVLENSMPSSTSIKIEPTAIVTIEDPSVIRPISDSDPISLRIGDKIYVAGNIIDSAAPQTFKKMTNCQTQNSEIPKWCFNNIYEDKDHYYFFNEVEQSCGGITSVDKATFVTADFPYFFDKNDVYFATDYRIVETVCPLNANQKTFEVLDLGWSRDANHLFFKDELVENGDPNSFMFTDDGYYYAKDARQVYYTNATYDDGQIYMRIVKGADPATFESLKLDWRSSFAKDGAHVFFNDVIIEGADPTSAKIFSNIPDVLVDNNHLFTIDQKMHTPQVTPVDGASFKIENADDPTNVLAVDKNRSYYFSLGDDAYNYTKLLNYN